MLQPDPSATQGGVPLPPVSNVFAKPSKIAWAALVLSISGYILLPMIGGVAGLLLGLFALFNDRNKWMPGAAIALGCLNLAIPLFGLFVGVCINISVCSLLGGASTGAGQ